MGVLRPEPSTPSPAPAVQWRGRRDYRAVWQEMVDYTARRGPASPDRLWLLEHPPVYTLGMNARAHHVLEPGDIAVVRCDRGGQVTYHGPGQLVAYCLLDLRRRGLGVRELVQRLEQSVIELLAHRGIEGARRAGAPGVYVAGAKIAALGIARAQRGQLSRLESERGYGSRTFHAHQSLRTSRSAGDPAAGPVRRERRARHCRRAGCAAGTRAFRRIACRWQQRDRRLHGAAIHRASAGDRSWLNPFPRHGRACRSGVRTRSRASR